MKSTYVSLGSNCCVTFWLKNYGLRKKAYPFDWTNITIKQLNNVLFNNFNEYRETLEIKFLSDKYPDKKGNPTFLLTNIYNAKFAHEVLDDNMYLEKFKISLANRIDRFKELKIEDHIVYIRLELTIIKSGYIKELEKLINLLDSINPNYIIKLIIHRDSIKINFKKVEIHYFDEFSPDWKMSHLDWKSILTDSSS